MNTKVTAAPAAILALILAAGQIAPTGATAQTRAGPSAEELAVSRIQDTAILHEADVKPLTVFEWERDGKVMNAWPGDGKTPPYDAARMELRLYNMPTGQLRRLRFPKGARTPPHMNDSDIVIYSLSGRQVQFVDEEADYDRAGDATFQPYGVNHHSETVVAAERLEFAFAPAAGSGRIPVFQHASETPEQLGADQVKGGVHEILLGPAAAAAPPNTRFRTRIFHFPGHSLTASTYSQGQVLPAHKAVGEELVFVVKGRLKLTLGAMSTEAGAGDFYRVANGQTYAREALEDTEVVEIEGSRAPPR